MQEKHIFGERVSCSCPYHVPTLTSKVSCNQRVFIAVNPGKKYTYAKYMWKMCVRIAMRYLCSIHIIDAYSSTTTRKMQVHQCI